MRKLDPVKHEERRREFLEAAERCFARDGFRGASISDICTEAKISPGHLYHYFKGKEAIIQAMAETHLAGADKQLEIISQSDDPIGTFVDELETNLSVKQSEFTFEVLAEAWRNPSMRQILRNHNLAFRSRFAAFLRKGQESGRVDRSLDPDLTASVLIAIRDLAKIMAARDPKLNKAGAGEHVKILITRFLRPETQ
jgi:TetR/AcrR family transcriptional regulator, repressor for uid operon